MNVKTRRERSFSGIANTKVSLILSSNCSPTILLISSSHVSDSIGLGIQIKEKNGENTDGVTLARRPRQHRPQDRLLAGRIRSSILCLRGCRRTADPCLTKGWATTHRSEERLTRRANARHDAVQARPRGTEGAFADG